MVVKKIPAVYGTVPTSRYPELINVGNIIT